jgi:abequosyltransferase
MTELTEPLLSICIPAYNRPRQLIELLRSIDCDPAAIEIVIAEDHSPGRLEIRSSVGQLIAQSPYTIRYIENEQNLGDDGNRRDLVSRSNGHFILFMGDDDLFVPQALSRFLAFLMDNLDKKYVLRSYLVRHAEGVEMFKYMARSTALPPGEETVAWLFKRSVSVAGFTIDRREAQRHATDEVDGTLLYQIYLMAEVCLQSPSVYCDFAISEVIQSYRNDKPMFGASQSEKGKYVPGTISADNSINFTKSYFELTEYLDKKHGTNLTEKVRSSLSKYAYPFLSIQRRRGRKPFLDYANRLERECGLGVSGFFHVYKWALYLLGEPACDRGIRLIKRVVGRTPEL